MNALAMMGAEFDELRARWSGMEPGEARDDLCDLLHERAGAIRHMSADDLAGLAIKAKALAWSCDLDRFPIDENDWHRHLMAEHLADLQRVAAA